MAVGNLMMKMAARGKDPVEKPPVEKILSRRSKKPR
jgi:hypothetical protein